MTTHEFVQVCNCLPTVDGSPCPIHDPQPSTTTTAACTRCIDLEAESARLKEVLLLIGNLASATLKGAKE